MFLLHWKLYYFNNFFSSFRNSYEMCKRIAFFKITVKFLIQNINLACGIHAFFISWVNLSNIYFKMSGSSEKLDVYLSWPKLSSIY